MLGLGPVSASPLSDFYPVQPILVGSTIPSRVAQVPFTGRALVLAAEPRVAIVPAEERQTTVPATSRVVMVPKGTGQSQSQFYPAA